MPRRRRALPEALIFMALVALFVGADLGRTVDVRRATQLSMLGWTAFALLVIVWVEAGRGWRALARMAGELLIVTSIAGAVLLFYYARAAVLAAGVHVDAIYSYLGLQWFIELRSPITFAGQTLSYHQFPMALLEHLPARAVGFERLGPFALHLGSMLQIALLLGAMGRVFLPGRLGAQALAAALASAVFSNRMLVQAYDQVGYAIPAICLGLLFLVILDRESVPDPDRIVGGLLALASMHFYTGAVFVLPVCLAWLLVRRHPLRRSRTFLRENAVLVAVVAIFVITLATHPELLMARIRDITVQGQGRQDELYAAVLTKVADGWRYLSSDYPREWLRSFMGDRRESWFLLDIAPLGGLLVPVVATTWMLSLWAMQGQGRRYALSLAAFAAALIVLAGRRATATRRRGRTRRISTRTCVVGPRLRGRSAGGWP